jgi:rod shape-determining protein MreC
MTKKLLDGKTIMIIAISVMIAFTTIISVNVFQARGPVTGVANFLTTPLKALTSNIARTFQSIYGYVYRYEQLVEDFERLNVQVQALRDLHEIALDLEEDNIRLREQLGFRQRMPGSVTVEAEILNPGAGNWSHNFTIDVGSADSEVSIGNSVITASGVLIGRVTDVGLSTSTVVSILDTTFAAVVHIGDSGETATARGDFSFMNLGLLVLDNIDDGTPVAPGDTIVTTGYAGVFPPGLVLGQVLEVFNHPTGIGRFATIRPILPIDSIRYVFVIVDFDAAPYAPYY